MKDRTANVLGTGIVSALLASCSAPVELENPLANRLERCETELKSCQGERQTCIASLDRVSSALNARTEEHSTSLKTLDLTKGELAACHSETVLLEEKASDLTQRRDELSQRLATSIAQKDVEIQLLKGKLSVRVLDRVLFASGSATVRPQGLIVLGKIGEVLMTGDEKIRVEGHTDDVPISEALKVRYPTNWELSGARAASVVRYFQDQHQIEGARLEAVGHAFYQAVSSNDSQESRQRNRRVEVVLSAIE